MPWLIYQIVYALVLIALPLLAVYVFLDEINAKWKVLMGYIPLAAGILTLYLWLHVKVFFDQLSKAARIIPAPMGAPAAAPAQQQPMTIAVMAPPYSGYHDYYDSPKRQQKFSGPIGPVVPATNKPMIPPPTPVVHPPTPVPKKID